MLMKYKVLSFLGEMEIEYPFMLVNTHAHTRALRGRLVHTQALYYPDKGADVQWHAPRRPKL